MAAESLALDLDLSEELFDFDELVGSIGAGAEELNAALDSVLGVMEPAVEPATSPVAAPFVTYVPPKTPPPLAPARTRPPLVTAPLSSLDADPTLPPPPVLGSAAPAGRRPALGSTILTALAAIVLVNLAMLAYVAHTLRSVKGLASSGGEQVLALGSPAAEPSARASRAEDPLVASQVAQAPQGVQALARAREALELGEFERARQILYALLAVVDRIAPGERREIEAQARLLVADSWRLEADGHEAAEEAAR